MDLEDKFLAKASGIRSLSSSVQSTPEKNGNSDYASKSPELLKFSTKKEILGSCIDKSKHSASSKCTKMTKNLKANNKSFKNSKEAKKSTSGSNTPSTNSRKQPRKGENPIRVPPDMDHSLDYGCSSSWICKNSACRAVLSTDDTFCKRCSCCICHLFDDNKDPSLWLECASDSGDGYFCGLSCHIECALQRRKVGVVDLGQLMQLDGSYCCASCGKVSGILGCWKKQLVIAKDARRVDILCYRIFLSHRLLNGTSRFKEMHEIVNDAKLKLETEVGQLDGISAKLARGIVSRLSIAGELQELCSLGIEKADEWLTNVSNSSTKRREGSLPPACGFMFEEITSSSVIIALMDLPNTSPDIIKGYKLWYCKSREEIYSKDPVHVFPRSQRRMLISNLQPCTEYMFRIISQLEDGDLGHSEAKCFTKSVEIIHKTVNSSINADCKKEKHTSCEKNESKTVNGSVSEFKVRDLDKFLHLARAQERDTFEESSDALIENCGQKGILVKSEPSFPLGLDLNLLSVPDLNEEFTPFDSSRDEDNLCIEKNGSDESQISTRGVSAEVPAVESWAERKRETNDCDSILMECSPVRTQNGSGSLDENFEYCVKMIRWLECQGYIKQDFRLKLLTWYSLRSSVQERRVVNTFIQTLIDDPSSLAGQLVDSFSDIISSKKPRNGFCSSLWH